MYGQQVDVVAWVTVIVCVFATVQCAIRYAKKHTRLYSSLTFFALCWAILLPYYGLMHLRTDWRESLKPAEIDKLTEIIELFPAYSGLLLTMAGGPLRREAHLRLNHHDPGVGRADSWVLTGLYLMVVPHLLVIAPFGIIKNFTPESLRILGLLFTLLGFYSIVEGLRVLAWGTEVALLEEPQRSQALDQGRRLPRSWGFWSVAIVAAIYSAYEIIYSGVLLTQKLIHASVHSMTSNEKFAFSVLKLLFVGTFLFAVVAETRRPHAHRGRLEHALSAKSSHS